MSCIESGTLNLSMYFVPVRDTAREGRVISFMRQKRRNQAASLGMQGCKTVPHLPSVKPSKCSFFLKIYILIFLLYHKTNIYTLEKFETM